jgi:hypothetical protein
MWTYNWTVKDFATCEPLPLFLVYKSCHTENMGGLNTAAESLVLSHFLGQCSSPFSVHMRAVRKRQLSRFVGLIA